MSREEQLNVEGWQKQATYDEPRLTEMADIYREIGMDVHFEPFHPDEEGVCKGCLATFPDRYQTIYTRRKEKSS